MGIGIEQETIIIINNSMNLCLNRPTLKVNLHSVFLGSLVGLFCLPAIVFAQVNNLSPTPYMGWNTYYGLGKNYDLETLKQIADALVSTGLRDKGYRILWIDTLWANRRNPDGSINPRFSIADIAQYCHDRKLKLGIYTDTGPVGCGQDFGSCGFYKKDMDQFVAWGCDAIKVDGCGDACDYATRREAYAYVRDAIAGRMIFNICCWGAEDPYLWGPLTGNSWRTGGDIHPTVKGVRWDVPKDPNTWMANLLAAQHPSHQGPNMYNDPDYLNIGEMDDGKSFGFSRIEERTYFSMWCVLGAPLILSADLRKVTPETLSIIGNEELIGIDQDPLCYQGVKMKDEGGLQVWCRLLAGKGKRAIALLNLTQQAADVTVAFKDLNLKDRVQLQDAWQKAGLGSYIETYTAKNVPSHGAVVLLAKGQEIPPASGYLSDMRYLVERNGWGPVQRNLSIEKKPLALDGKTYTKGLGAHATSEISFPLNGAFERFTCKVGVDDEVGDKGSVVFQVHVDAQKKFVSGLMTGKDPSASVDVDVRGGHWLRLTVLPNRDDAAYDHGDWVEPWLTVASAEKSR